MTVTTCPEHILCTVLRSTGLMLDGSESLAAVPVSSGISELMAQAQLSD